MAPRQQTRRAQTAEADHQPFAPLEGEVMAAGMIADRVDGQELATIDLNEAQSIAMNLQRAEVDQQVATAKRYPRTITEAKRRIESLATLDAEAAAESIYALERTDKDGKKTQIIGPSIRFAEIVQQCWWNCRVAARVTDLGKTHVEATGIFFDLEANVATAKSVQRRITTKTGRRYGDDMINVTANAAASIALRNAILAGVPKAVWREAFQKALSITRGTADTLNARKAKMVQAFKAQGATQAQIWQILGVKGEADVTLDTMVVAAGLLNALADGSVTVASLLADAEPAGTPGPGVADAHGAPAPGAAAQPKEEQAKPAEQPKADETPHDPQTGEVEDFPGDKPAQEQPKPKPPPKEEPKAQPKPADQPPEPKDEPAAKETPQDAQEDAAGDTPADDAADKPQAPESGQDDAAEGESEADEPPSALAVFTAGLGGTKSWAELSALMTGLLKSDWWAAAEPAARDLAYARAWEQLQTFPPGDDVPSPKRSPAAFRLFLAACRDPDEIERVWSDLVSSPAYSGMKEGARTEMIAQKKARKAALTTPKE